MENKGLDQVSSEECPTRPHLSTSWAHPSCHMPEKPYQAPSKGAQAFIDGAATFFALLPTLWTNTTMNKAKDILPNIWNNTNFDGVRLVIPNVLSSSSFMKDAIVGLWKCALFVWLRESVPAMWNKQSNSLDKKPKVKKREFIRCHSFDEVQHCFREPGILNGYRSDNFTVFQAFISIFYNTNETMNVWTHFLPFLYFGWIFYELSKSLPLFTDNYYSPLTCYLVTLCLYPIMSATAHAFSCISLSATHICYFMDYAALSIYSWGCALLYYNYLFPTTLFKTGYSSTYLPTAVVFSFLSTLLACCSRFYSSRPRYTKILRLFSFVIPCAWVSFPLILRLVYCDPNTDSCGISGGHHVKQFIYVLMASFFYASHIPERFAPGYFDFFGHSHNLLHIFSSLASSEQLLGALVDLEERKDVLKKFQWNSNTNYITIGTPLVVIFNVLIICLFTKMLMMRNENKPTEFPKNQTRFKNKEL